MKQLALLAALVLLAGCNTTPKMQPNGEPPPGYILVPKPPTPFCE